MYKLVQKTLYWFDVRGRASPAGSRSVSPSRAFDSELGALAAWISEKYTGMGKSPAEALPGECTFR
jgi:hypothetical protein